MENTKDILKYESVLPTDFDGTFRFTNWTDSDFIGKWGNKEYRFPAHTTSPIIMTNHTPLEIQQIRKKFAKDLADQEYGKSEGYANLLKQERNPDGSPRLATIRMAGTYSMNDLTSFIQKCLVPLETGTVQVSEVVQPTMEDKLSRADDGTLNTQAIDRKMSLRQKALDA